MFKKFLQFLNFSIDFLKTCLHDDYINPANAGMEDKMNFEPWLLDYHVEYFVESRRQSAQATYTEQASELVALVAIVAGAIRKLASRVENWADGDIETTVMTKAGARSR